MNNDPLTQEELQWAANLKRVWLRKKKELSLSQEKVAELYGCTQGNVSQYLNAKIPLNTNAVYKFARILQVAPTEINPTITDLIPSLDPSNVRSAMDLLPLIERLPPKEAAKFLGMAEAIVDKKLKEK